MKNDQMVTVTQLRRNFVFLEVMWMIRKIISGLPFIPLFSIESVNQKRHLNISESTNYKFTLNKWAATEGRAAKNDKRITSFEEHDFDKKHELLEELKE
jgi:lipopolysaccharide export LptBFGC system permease protein LptF